MVKGALMKKIGIVYFVLISLLVVSCSKSSKKSDPEKSTESVAKTDDSKEEKSDELTLNEDDLEETKEEELISEDEPEQNDSATKDKGQDNTAPQETSELAGEGQNKEIDLNLSPGVYKVQKGETLMLIAFKLYGDYGKWKKIQQNNPQLKGKPLRAGMKIAYEAPSEKFDWSPQGLPHLIKRGDTLGKISKNKYGTSKKWKTIWDNNKPLIKDPNLIFAGFTLYYVPLGKELASW